MKKESDKCIEIYTDGACSGNPGPGGYGAIVKNGDRVREISGCERMTTNNRMEMRAVIEALSLLEDPRRVLIITDSDYVVKGMTQWLPGWIRRNWVNAQKKPVLNRDLWERLLELSRPHKIEWKWVRGHDGHEENERCDRLAREAIRHCR
jgi:ribonuclease HI